MAQHIWEEVVETYTECGFKVKKSLSKKGQWLLENLIHNGYIRVIPGDDIWVMRNNLAGVEVPILPETQKVLEEAFALPPIHNGYLLSALLRAGKEAA